MNDKKIISYIDYLKIIDVKYQILKKLEYLLNNEKEEKIIVNSKELALLFLIDFNNLNLESFNEDELEEITEIIDFYTSTKDKKYHYTTTRLSELLNHIKKYRIPPNLNQKIAISFATEFNKTTSSPFNQIDKANLEKICQSIK